MPTEHAEYLVVASHPDDAELGMGGTIVKLLGAGKSVAVCDLTSGEPTPFGTPARRRRETRAASAALGLTHRVNLGLKNRALKATLAARAKLAQVYRAFRPRVVFIPYWRDAHPDHLAATQLAIQARFHAKLTKTRMAGRPHYPERVLFYYCTHLRGEKQHPGHDERPGATSARSFPARRRRSPPLFQGAVMRSSDRLPRPAALIPRRGGECKRASADSTTVSCRMRPVAGLSGPLDPADVSPLY